MNEREIFFSEMKIHRDSLVSEINAWDFEKRDVKDSREFVGKMIIRMLSAIPHYDSALQYIPETDVPKNIALFMSPYETREVGVVLDRAIPREGFHETYRHEPSAVSHISIEFGIADSGIDFVIFESEAIAMPYGRRGKTEGVSRFTRSYGNDEKVILSTAANICKSVMVNDEWLKEESLALLDKK